MSLGYDRYFDDRTSKSLRDPVHRADILLSPYEIRIINTRAFQRLRGIKQLGPCEVVWHCANHTRFQHSIGTLYMAQKILHQIDPHYRHMGFAKHVIVRLFALLHDIGHLPFGHTLEDERPAVAGHHTSSSRIQSVIREEIAPILDEVQRLMDKGDQSSIGIDLKVRDQKIKSIEQLLVELISNFERETINRPDIENADDIPRALAIYQAIVGDTVCADLFDYLRRDTYFTGLRREFDDKIISHLQIEDGQIVFDLLSDKAGQGGGRTELMNLMHVRYSLAERVYFNKTKVWAGAMLSKAVELAGISIDMLLTLRDGELLWILENAEQYPQLIPQTNYEVAYKGPFEKAVKDTLGTDHFYWWSTAWQRMKGKLNQDLGGAAKLASAYNRRAIFRPVYSAASSSEKERSLFMNHFHDAGARDFRRTVEAFLAELCGLEPWQVVIACPNPNMNLKWADPLIGPFRDIDKPSFRRLSDVSIKSTVDEELKPLIEAAGRVCVDHQRLWRFDVSAPEDLPRDAQSKLCGVCQDIFKLDNRADAGKICSENLTTLLTEKATIACREVFGEQFEHHQLEGLLALSQKGRKDMQAPPPCSVDDFKRMITALNKPKQGIVNDPSGSKALFHDESAK